MIGSAQNDIGAAAERSTERPKPLLMDAPLSVRIPWNFADRAYLVYFAVVSGLILVRWRHVPGAATLLLVNAVCIAIIFALVQLAPRSPNWAFLHDWYPVAMPIVTFEQVSRLSLTLRSGWQDHYILNLESHLFPIPPTVWLGQHATGWTTELVEIGYFSYFVLLMIVAGTLYVRADRRPFRQTMDASVLSYLLCYVVFILFPTEGPAHTLAAKYQFALPGGGPFHWVVLLIQKHAGVHGNAFPSAHVAGGLVAVIAAWRFAPKLGAALTPLMILLCVGAVYDRYHYASDVVAGLVFGAVPAWIMLRRRFTPAGVP
jgi:membrane-associated phospholipid phosphatase